jgi:hypothetical protein
MTSSKRLVTFSKVTLAKCDLQGSRLLPHTGAAARAPGAGNPRR